MKAWRKKAIKKEKEFQRNVWIALVLLLVAFLAKMEAINFLISAAAAVFFLAKTYRPILASFEISDEIISEKIYPLSPSIAAKLIWGMLTWDRRLPGFIWLVIGLGSGYLLYVLLNMIFISP